MQPRNVSVEVGKRSTFTCTYNGSVGIPTWIINGREFAYSAPLPSKHDVDFTGSYLIVQNVDISMDGNRYQCVINSCFSDIGYLHVVSLLYLGGTYVNVAYS